jgi:predicted nucleic acid-binding protein
VRIVVLDSGPLRQAAMRPVQPNALRCHAWLAALESSGVLVAVPEFADYEIRRELIRAGITAGIARLDALKKRFLYVPITTAAMLKAAELWGAVRVLGIPTAAPDALDGDCIVAAQAITASGPQDTVTIATKNVGHFGRFTGVGARVWDTIVA